MRRKLTLWTVAVATVLNLGLAVAAPALACVCEVGSAGCSGECCKTSGGECICGPCDIILT